MYKRGSLENMTNQLSSNNVGYPLEACQNDDIAFLQIFPEVVSVQTHYCKPNPNPVLLII